MTTGRPTATAPEPAQPGHVLLKAGREHGWQVALTRLHALAGAETILVGPAGHAVLCPQASRTAVRLRVGTTFLARDRAREQALPVPVTGVVALRVGTRPAAADPFPWATVLAGLRLGLSQGLLDRAVAHLGRRSTGGQPLLRHQALQVAVADLVIEHLEIGCELDLAEGLDPAAAADLHRRITRADRSLLHLFGAHGYELDGPAATGYVSELLADAYGDAGSEAVPA